MPAMQLRHVAGVVALLLAVGATVAWSLVDAPGSSSGVALTSATVAICAALSAMAGLGGGALFVPIYVVLLGSPVHDAVALSSWTIFGLSVGGVMVLMGKRHPSFDSRPLIDYDLCGLIIPNILLGTLGGVLLNSMSPDYLVVLVLLTLLAVVGFRTWRKAFQLYACEVSASQTAAAAESAAPLHSTTLPWRKFATFALCLMVVVALAAAKGGPGKPSLLGVQCGSLAFWSLMALAIPRW